MKKIILGIIILVLIVGGFYFFTHNSSSNSNSNPSKTTTNTNPSTETVPSSEAKVVTLNAKRWQYAPEKITVKKGNHVKIMITNQDTVHGISIPDYNVQGIDSVEFTADKTGSFQFHCPTFCGSGHKNMTGTLVVTD